MHNILFLLLADCRCKHPIWGRSCLQTMLRGDFCPVTFRPWAQPKTSSIALHEVSIIHLALLSPRVTWSSLSPDSLFLCFLDDTESWCDLPKVQQDSDIFHTWMCPPSICSPCSPISPDHFWASDHFDIGVYWLFWNLYLALPLTHSDAEHSRWDRLQDV